MKNAFFKPLKSVFAKHKAIPKLNRSPINIGISEKGNVPNPKSEA